MVSPKGEAINELEYHLKPATIPARQRGLGQAGALIGGYSYVLLNRPGRRCLNLALFGPGREMIRIEATYC